jgi:hypothetical protein
MPPALYRLDAIRSDGLTFMEVIVAAMETPELIRCFDRLYGANLMRRGLPIELAIDDACGRTNHDCRGFLNFLWEFVFTRTPITKLPPEKAAEVLAFAKEHKLPFMALRESLPEGSASESP